MNIYFMHCVYEDLGYCVVAPTHQDAKVFIHQSGILDCHYCDIRGQLMQKNVDEPLGDIIDGDDYRIKKYSLDLS